MRLTGCLAWLPLASIATCSLLMALVPVSGRCWGIPWLCHERSVARDLATMAAAVSLPVLLALAWGLSSGLRQLARTRRALRHLLGLPRLPLAAPLRALARELDVEDQLDVLVCAAAEACCYGLIRPRICLTTGLLSVLSPAEIEAVLRHERHHLRRHDPLRSLLWTMLGGVCWWGVDGAEQARLQRELAADRAVIAAGGRQALASALLKLLTYYHGGSQSIVRTAAGTAISGLSVTDARIDQLLQPELPAPPAMPVYRPLVLPALTVVAMFLCTLLMARP